MYSIKELRPEVPELWRGWTSDVRTEALMVSGRLANGRISEVYDSDFPAIRESPWLSVRFELQSNAWIGLGILTPLVGGMLADGKELGSPVIDQK